MHDAALAAHTTWRFPFMLHWTRSTRREGRGGDSDQGSVCTLMAPLTLMTDALNSDLMIPSHFREAKLTL